MHRPFKARPSCTLCVATGLFVQSETPVRMTGGRIGDVAAYGQESNSTTRRLAMMNRAIRGIEGDLRPVYVSKLEAAIKTNWKGLGYGS